MEEINDNPYEWFDLAVKIDAFNSPVNKSLKEQARSYYSCIAFLHGFDAVLEKYIHTNY